MSNPGKRAAPYFLFETNLCTTDVFIVRLAKRAAPIVSLPSPSYVILMKEHRNINVKVKLIEVSETDYVYHNLST